MRGHLPRRVTQHQAAAALATEPEYGCDSAGMDEDNAIGAQLLIWEECR